VTVFGLDADAVSPDPRRPRVVVARRRNVIGENLRIGGKGGFSSGYRPQPTARTQTGGHPGWWSADRSHPAGRDGLIGRKARVTQGRRAAPGSSRPPLQLGRQMRRGPHYSSAGGPPTEPRSIHRGERPGTGAPLVSTSWRTRTSMHLGEAWLCWPGSRTLAGGWIEGPIFGLRPAFICFIFWRPQEYSGRPGPGAVAKPLFSRQAARPSPEGFRGALRPSFCCRAALYGAARRVGRGSQSARSEYLFLLGADVAEM